MSACGSLWACEWASRCAYVVGVLPCGAVTCVGSAYAVRVAGGGGSSRLPAAALYLERADVAMRHAVVIAILWARDAALIDVERAALLSRAVRADVIDGGAACQQRVGPGGAAVVGQRPEQRIRIDQITGCGEAAGVGAVQIVALRRNRSRAVVGTATRRRWRV